MLRNVMLVASFSAALVLVGCSSDNTPTTNSKTPPPENSNPNQTNMPKKGVGRLPGPGPGK